MVAVDCEVMHWIFFCIKAVGKSLRPKRRGSFPFPQPFRWADKRCRAAGLVQTARQS